MPDLNIKGNIIDNFGTFLPTPIIDSVAIYNDKIRINLSLFFNFTDLDITDDEIDDYLEYLSNTTTGAPLYVYGAYILGQSYIDSILNKNNIDIMTELYGASEARFEQEDTSWETSTSANNSYKIFDVNIFVRSDQNFYDNADNKVIQYGGFIELPIVIGNKELSISDLQNNIFLAGNPLADTLQDMSVFAFTSWLALPGAPTDTFIADTSSVPYIVNNVDDDDRIFTSLKIDLLPPLAEQQVSNISYTSVFKGGHADVEPKVHFIDENEVFYNKTPIQVIDGKYYKQDAYTLEQIVALFESYISSHKMAGEDNEDVKSVLNNIAYVLSLYGDTTQLLIELNKLRQTFPEKSSATEVGSLYAGFKDRFFGANEKVAAGTPVVEKLVRTSKIRDLREVLTQNWVAPEQTDQNVILATRSNGGFISAQLLYGSVYDYDSSLNVPDLLIKNGYWFFNYEEALKRYAAATVVFSLDSLENLFGSILHSRFKIDKARMKKYVWIPFYGWSSGIGNTPEDAANSGLTELPIDQGVSCYLISEFESTIEYKGLDNFSFKKGPRTTEFKLSNYDAPVASNSEDWQSQLWISHGPDVYVSYLAIRGVDAINDPQITNGSYPLVCFDFQDVEKGYETGDQLTFYTFEVDVKDTTKSLIQQITSSFVDYNDELKEYYDYAQENCSYNNIDGTFNEFFTEGIMNFYRNTSKKDYPWIRAPILYNFQREMVTNAFGGDETKLVEDAQAISAKINPINGTLENLEAFYSNYKTFMEDFYLADSSDLATYINKLPDERTLKFGEDGTVQYFPMPEPVALVSAVISEAAEEIDDSNDDGTTTDSGPCGPRWETNAAQVTFDTYFSSKTDKNALLTALGELEGWPTLDYDTDIAGQVTLDNMYGTKDNYLKAYKKIAKWLENHDSNSEQQRYPWDHRHRGVSSVHKGILVDREGKRTRDPWTKEYIMIALYENAGVATLRQYIWTDTSSEPDDDCHLPTYEEGRWDFASKSPEVIEADEPTDSDFSWDWSR